MLVCHDIIRYINRVSPVSQSHSPSSLLQGMMRAVVATSLLSPWLTLVQYEGLGLSDIIA